MNMKYRILHKKYVEDRYYPQYRLGYKEWYCWKEYDSSFLYEHDKYYHSEKTANNALSNLKNRLESNQEKYLKVEHKSGSSILGWFFIVTAIFLTVCFTNI